nr:hypothetical protein [Jatrophihabitans endophyticus]
MEVHALRARGWSISAIARHTGRDRKTVRAYLNGERQPGQRARAEDPFTPFVEYVSARLVEDPHLWALTLFDELAPLGFTASYQTLTREIRTRKLRPVCTACASAVDRVNGIIEHPAGEETQWDWLDLPNPPASWGWGSMAHLLVGSLAHSGRWRAVLAPSMEQARLVDGLDRVSRALGGATKVWRFDRMATVCHPDSGKVTASFAAVAKHYGVSVAICPPRAGHRKGVVEKVNHTAAQRCWRTLPDDATPESAQAVFDQFAATRGDTRMRPGPGGKSTVATLAAAEPLRPVPAPFPALLRDERVVSRQALIAYRGNRYSVSPELVGTTVEVTRRLDAAVVDVVTTSSTGRQITIARHRLAADGAGAVIRDDGHVIALEAAVLAASTSGGRPHRRKERIPPGPAAQAAAAVLRGDTSDIADTGAPVVDLTTYERLATGRNTLT